MYDIIIRVHNLISQLLTIGVREIIITLKYEFLSYITVNQNILKIFFLYRNLIFKYFIIKCPLCRETILIFYRNFGLIYFSRGRKADKFYKIRLINRISHKLCRIGTRIKLNSNIVSVRIRDTYRTVYCLKSLYYKQFLPESNHRRIISQSPDMFYFR